MGKTCLSSSHSVRFDLDLFPVNRGLADHGLSCKMSRTEFPIPFRHSESAGSSEEAVATGLQTNRVMVGEGEEREASGECKFPNVRKAFWRSATWNSHSVPSSPKVQPVSCLGASKEALVPLTPRCNKVRSSLPPLQPLSITRKSLEEWPRAGLDDISDWATPTTPCRRVNKSGPEIKLDLASVQRIDEPTEIQLKRDKFAFFDKECSRVAEHIYLGSDAVAKNRDTLKANSITHVLNCVGFVCPEYFKDDFVYKTLWLQDSPCEDITSLLYDVFDYFEEVREQGGRVFVHCCQGVSRSTSLVIAYLMWRDGRSFEDAFQDVKAARGITNPNMGFACQLLQCQKRVHAAPMSPNSVLRMYRLAPHSPYDPLHLVPKTVNNPGAAALDSRGAFVIHVPHAIYVWVGHLSHSRIAQAARGAADQVVRYERAQGQVIVCNEGKEIPAFWEALSKCPLSTNHDKAESEDLVQESSNGVEKCDFQAEKKWRVREEQVKWVRSQGVGKKKVTSYDVDFELFLRARQGGVVPPVPSSGVGAATIATRLPAREDGWSRLRRKFPWGRGLVAAATTAGNLASSGMNPSNKGEYIEKQLQSVEKQENNMPSPDPSMSSSSLQFSPFASPISVSDPPPSPVLDWSPSAFLAPSPASSPKASCFVEHLPVSPEVKAVPPSSSKGSSMSLAQRRGSISPSLYLPALVDDSSIAPRRRPIIPRLPPRDEVEKDKTDTGVEENGEPSFRFEGFDELCSDLADRSKGYMRQVDNQSPIKSLPSKEHLPKGLNTVEQEATSVNIGRQQNLCLGSASQLTMEGIFAEKPAFGTRLPVLYDWPGMEKIDMFDADDLNTQTAFVLVAPETGHSDGTPGQILYVWVGRELISENEQDSHLNSTGDAKGEVSWQQIGRTFIERMQLWRDIPVKVIKEGEEPEEFWNNFIHG